MATNPDFRDLLSALSAEGAEFLVVGAHAVMFLNKSAVGRPQDLLDVDVLRRSEGGP